ncbi:MULTISPECIES: GntR family transcriptional regulator [Bacillaceae]|uniref:GntR family transcriptional regulator n=1 Tax=Cytobacillus firmus TaxID=1399 RepID=A0AA46SJ59_CYTFI|nr:MULTISPECIES: GntR family transcriptional regulator [Bacillaceae]KML36085.1 transcriptional regulator [Cytobacillus firmus]MCC3646372.1 GntR family transcriptional regulator [Cytobacillus oceanisediminis]MCS0652965.1 GntR family transcriptional regulator [Cytobacillus firmus]MCU1803836.1 GntR family transcriptional regulator [Cytobacillus firmus]UYG95782.1 GntR family transcriptional regulator [Cytobacillus firmus]
MDAYEYIKDAIIEGKFVPGMRLAEESLAKKMNISRTPIREAIRQLEAEGLVIPLKRGVSVRHFTKDDIRQIYDLRTLLEGYAASQAAIHRSESDLLKMESANILYEEAISRHVESNMESLKDIVQVNQKFHEAIVAASKNEHIHFHISKVVVVPIVFRSFYWYNSFQLKQSLEVHKTILEAIKNREPERARIAMHEHIYQGRDHVLKHLEQIKNIHLLKEEGK